MNSSRFPALKYAAIFCIGVCCSVTALGQSYRSEATLLPNFFLDIPVLKVDDKFYQVSLAYQAPTWTLQSAVEISSIDADYATGTYANNVLDLKCVRFGADYYSARLVSAAPDNYSFTLASSTKLADCPLPPGLGAARGKWIRTADSPLSARTDASIVWNGQEIIVFGGWEFFCGPVTSCITPSAPPFADGAAYNPATDSWRKIADAPAGIQETITARVASDIFVLAYTGFAAGSVRLFRYRSSQDRWDEIDMPVDPRGMTLAPFGSNIVLYAYEDKTGSTPDWLLDTANGRWTALPDAPLGPAFSRQYVALGEDLYLFDHALTPSPGGASGPSYVRAARLRGQQWKLLPVSDSIRSAPTLIAGRRIVAPELGCADGGKVNGYGRCIPYGAVFDTETETWQELPQAPGRGLKYIQSSGGFSDGNVLLSKAGHPALDAVTNEWFLVPQLDTNLSTQRSMRGAGPYGFAFGGASAGQLLKESWIWKP